MATTSETIPPLLDGDRLTRLEFERRFDAMPGLKIAELIEGTVRIPSTGSHSHHAGPCFDLIGWMGQYSVATSYVTGSAHSHLRLDSANVSQPDALLMLCPGSNGRPRLDDEGCLTRAPELVAEVTESITSYDLHEKRGVYRQYGVREYIIWRVLDQAIDWFILREGSYERLPADANGIYKSEVFPGLWLDTAALLRGDLVAVVQMLQEGLASPEHAAFVTRLQQSEPSGE